MSLRIGALLAAAFFVASCSSSQAAPPPPASAPPAAASPAPAPTLTPSEPFPVATVTLHSPTGESVEVPVYVASTPSQRARGLMERDDLPDGTGMVFLFPEERRGAFYMYRTLIPLTIAFADAQGRVVSILDMAPCPSDDPAACERYDPGVPYRTALEVEQGYLAELGVTTDWRLELPPELRSPS